jgi:hypothetical protein
VSSTRTAAHAREGSNAENRIPLAASGASHGSAADSSYLLARLSHLRTILPVFAQELAVARHQVTSLRAENGGLQQALLQMQTQPSATSHSVPPER